MDHLASSSVSTVDCRYHTWRQDPSLMVERFCPSASVVDGKTYVGGGCQIDSIEVFDVKMQTWGQVPSPDPYLIPNWGYPSRCVCIDGKFHLIVGAHGLAYDPVEGRWELVESEMIRNLTWSYCAIENVLYSFCEGMFKWHDNKARLWKNVKGLQGLPKLDRFVKLADYGGKLAVLWDKVSFSGHCKKRIILCAEIAMERRNKDEIWGKVEWLDNVPQVPDPYHLMKILSATL